MKNLSFLAIFLLLSSCGGRDEKICKCTQQRWEKKITRNIATQAVVSETDWQKVGPEISSGTECNKNGYIPNSGNTAVLDPGGQTSTETHYKEVVTCL